jgi:CLIP-associating protein 1/2
MCMSAYCCLQVLAATNTIRDALIGKVEAVYGLTTVHGSLRAFLAEPIPTKSSSEARDTSLAFGLMALGKFTLQLPAEILEDELPRLKGTIVPVSVV